MATPRRTPPPVQHDGRVTRPARSKVSLDRAEAENVLSIIGGLTLQVGSPDFETVAPAIARAKSALLAALDGGEPPATEE